MLTELQTEEPLTKAPPEPITIAFNAPDGPVTGTVCIAGGEPAAFHGWLELMDALERLRLS
jgi:organic radical activating enzyme